MKSEIWDEKKAQKAKTIVQYLIDNVKNVSVTKTFHSSTNQKPIFLPISHENYFCTHTYVVTCLIQLGFYTLRTHTEIGRDRSCERNDHSP